jgi:hypothetical protein
MVAKAVGSLKNLPTNNRCTRGLRCSKNVLQYTDQSRIIRKTVFDFNFTEVFGFSGENSL